LKRIVTAAVDQLTRSKVEAGKTVNPLPKEGKIKSKIYSSLPANIMGVKHLPNVI
jgi:hypothetical protein